MVIWQGGGNGGSHFRARKKPSSVGIEPGATVSLYKRTTIELWKPAYLMLKDVSQAPLLSHSLHPPPLIFHDN